MNDRPLTETCDCCQSRKDNNPVFSLPDDPAAVDEDEVAEVVAERDEDVRAYEFAGFVCKALHHAGSGLEFSSSATVLAPTRRQLTSVVKK